MKKVQAVQSESGDWYVIPNDMAEAFEELSLCDDWETFESTFSQYATGGDLNNTQLYIP